MYTYERVSLLQLLHRIVINSCEVLDIGAVSIFITALYLAFCHALESDVK